MSASGDRQLMTWLPDKPRAVIALTTFLIGVTHFPGLIYELLVLRSATGTQADFMGGVALVLFLITLFQELLRAIIKVLEPYARQTS
jgi:hypothetical protein